MRQKRSKNKTVYRKANEVDVVLQDIVNDPNLRSIWPELHTYKGPMSQRTAVWRVEQGALKKMKEILAAAGLEEEDIYYGND